MAKPFATPEIWNRAQSGWIRAVEDAHEIHIARWDILDETWWIYESLFR